MPLSLARKITMLLPHAPCRPMMTKAGMTQLGSENQPGCGRWSQPSSSLSSPPSGTKIHRHSRAVETAGMTDGR